MREGGMTTHRASDADDETDEPTVTKLDYGDLTIDLLAYEVLLDDAAVELSRREFQLLVCLASSPRRTFSPIELLERVWDATGDGDSLDTVREHVYRLRKKLEVDPAQPQRIVTVRGFGYRFEP